ncbi:hypothetical protein ACFQO1_10910 [Jejudonia soesokkakensis]|uniref:Uncharacterized protein n=1 Tax=Jejudonia soesokkakensis TaxID=1323432 RepID=A0ABW2MXF2_9FLAO
MKLLATVCALVFLCAHPPIHNTPTYELSEAINKGMVTVEVKKTPESTHYFEPLSITVTNLTSKKINITIPNGQLFVSTDPEVQDIITTEANDLIVTNTPVTKAIQGMCVQSNNRAPRDEDTYSAGKVASGNLLKLTQEIEQTKSFNSIAQHAIWAITDNHSVEDIYSLDDENNTGTHFQSFTREVLGVSTQEKIRSIPATDKPKRTMGGTFTYYFSQPSSVSIAIFNDKNVVVRELFQESQKKAGEHNFDFQFDASDFPEDLYFVKLIINDRVKINKRLIRKT